MIKHIRRFFAEIEKKKYRVHVRVFISRYRAYTTVSRLSWWASAA